MANNNHVTKADLKALRDELKADMKAFKDELAEMIRDVETKLLKAFYGFAETTQKRLTENERATSGVADRIEIIERRVTDLEKRVNFPHAP